LIKYLLEETYEVVDALQDLDPDGAIDRLGADRGTR
jgi:uncharacterized protein YabN with tetrapyrrole methylase and pyrophosphatase domain